MTRPSDFLLWKTSAACALSHAVSEFQTFPTHFALARLPGLKDSTYQTLFSWSWTFSVAVFSCLLIRKTSTAWVRRPRLRLTLRKGLFDYREPQPRFAGTWAGSSPLRLGFAPRHHNRMHAEHRINHKKPRSRDRGILRAMTLVAYLIEVEIVVNVVERDVPTAVTAPMMTTAIRAAISPYSIAVAPLSSLIKRVKISIVPCPEKSPRTETFTLRA